MFTTVLFDFDGTVFDTGEGIKKSALYALNKHGIQDDIQNMDFFVGPPLIDSFMTYGMSREEAVQAVVDYRERYVPIGLYECSIYSGMDTLLKDLKAHGAKLGIATSKPLDMAETLLKTKDLYDIFNVRCGTPGGIVNLSKADVINLALRQLGEPDRGKVLMVGDTRFDIEGARECGVKAVGVSYGYGTEESLTEAAPDYLAGSVAELHDLLLELVAA